MDTMICNFAKLQTMRLSYTTDVRYHSSSYNTRRNSLNDFHEIIYNMHLVT